MQPLLEPPHCLHLKKCSSHAPELLRDLMQHKGNGDNRGRDNSGISVKTKWFHQAQLLRLSRPLDTHCRGRARLYPNPKDFVRHKDTLGHHPGSHWLLAHHFGAGPGGQESLSPTPCPWRKWESAVNRCDSKWELALRVSAWMLMVCKPQKQNGQCRMGWGSSSSLRAKQNHPG